MKRVPAFVRSSILNLHDGVRVVAANALRRAANLPQLHESLNERDQCPNSAKVERCMRTNCRSPTWKCRGGLLGAKCLD